MWDSNLVLARAGEDKDVTQSKIYCYRSSWRDEIETEEERERRWRAEGMHHIFSPKSTQGPKERGKWMKKEKLKSKTHSPFGTPGTALTHLCGWWNEISLKYSEMNGINVVSCFPHHVPRDLDVPCALEKRCSWPQGGLWATDPRDPVRDIQGYKSLRINKKGWKRGL